MKKSLGLIVTFNPSIDFFSDLDSFYSQLDQIVLIDNGSNPEILSLLKREEQYRNRSLTVLYNKTNLGVATALNQGFQWAIARGYRQIVTFDQDSRPAPGMVSTLLDVYESYSTDESLAVVAPIIDDPSLEISARYLSPKSLFTFRLVTCTDCVLDNVLMVITSGSLYNLDIYQRIGPFRDDLFIDYVDTEYCLRVKENGYRILVACKAYLHHRLGNQQKRVFLGKVYYPTFHSILRWYYISRNRVWMLKQYAIRHPYWFFYELVVSIKSVLRMLMFEDCRMSKVKAFILGTIDGLFGRMGKKSDTITKITLN